MGSFRLAVGRRHLYRHCNFTGMFVETVSKSLRLSCGSELHVTPIFLLALTISSSLNFYRGRRRVMAALIFFKTLARFKILLPSQFFWRTIFVGTGSQK